MIARDDEQYIISRSHGGIRDFLHIPKTRKRLREQHVRWLVNKATAFATMSEANHVLAKLTDWGHAGTITLVPVWTHDPYCLEQESN